MVSSVATGMVSKAYAVVDNERKTESVKFHLKRDKKTLKHTKKGGSRRLEKVIKFG